MPLFLRLWFFVLLCTLPACLTTGARSQSPALPTAGFTGLHVGDIIEVRVFDEDDLSGTYQITDEGGFNFPLIGMVQADRRTPQQVSLDIQERLGQGFLRQPHVMVLIKERQNLEVTVLGEVQKPGSFAYKDGLSVVQAVSLAGGLTRFAAPKQVKLTRRSQSNSEGSQKVNLSAMMQGKTPDIPLQPGDTLFVPESRI